MKKYILSLSLLTIFSCEKVKETSIEKIEVKAVNLNIDTSADVNCNDFELTFDNQINTFSVNNSSLLYELETLLKKCDKSNDNPHLDVRRKIIVFYKDKSIDTLCVDKFNVYINDQLVEKNSRLLNLLLSLEK